MVRYQRWLQAGVFYLLVAISGSLLPGTYYVTLLNLIGLHIIIVLGLNLLMGYAGQISLGHAAFFGLGAYASAILTTTYRVDPLLALLAGLLLSTLVAVVVGIPALKLKGYYLAMATLGFGIIVAIALQEMDWLTGGPSGFMGIPPLGVLGWQLQTPAAKFFLVWALVGLLLFLSLNIVDSRIGRALRAIHDSETAALAMGVDAQRLKLLIFVVSAWYASLAGSLLAHTVNFIAPSSFGFMFSIKLVTMVVVGGMASIWGSLLGATVLTVLPELLTVFHDLEVVVFGLILMVVMIFLPRGLVRGLLDLWEFRRRKQQGR
ncbi:MAG: branched-chain amino acid ABC transporter permease [Desulfobacca sp.]|uniref:branched-chain amino acid ABC transporter permease n=1 Tax=Desulfobacca sp. TaxID=2067990 RepID=UPI004049AFD5